MKKKFSIIIITILLFGLSTLVGCEMDSATRIDGIYIQEGTSFQIAVGDFDCMDYTVVAVSGKMEYYYPLTLDMLSTEDVFKLYKAGTYNLTVNAFDHSCEIEIEVLDNAFTGVELIGVETDYTGEEFHAELVGALPQGTQIIYPDGNSFTEVGTYHVTAVLICPNYPSRTLTADVKIKRAKYDMTGVTFESETFVYDGTDKSISVKGELPAGVTVSYKIGSQITNTQRLANENGYRVEAIFKSANVNYEEIESKFAFLTIKKADYDMSALEFEDREEYYSGNAYDVYFDKEDKLPKGCTFNDVTARYIGLDGEEHVVTSTSKLVSSSVRKSVQLVNAYDYTVEYSFNVGDTFNYNVPEPVTHHFNIKKVEYEYYNLDFLSDSFEYDGTPKMLEVTGDYGEELHISFEGNGMVNVGKYDVTAHFTVYDGVNYIAPKSMHATLIILQANFVLSSDYFTYVENVQYTGEPVLPEVNSTLPVGLELETHAYKISEGTDGEIIEEEVDAPIEIGSYNFKITVVGESVGNYHKINDLVLPYNIIRRSFDFSDFVFVNEFDYDGSLHTPEVLNLPVGLSVSFDKQAKDVKDGVVETTATFEIDGDFYAEHYVLPSPIKTYVKINPIRYKSYYKFNIADKHVTYDNAYHDIVGTITGDYVSSNDLKNNVNITYTLQKKGLDRILEGNGTAEVGEYIVTAHIELKNDKNFYFDEYTATLIIDHGNVKASDIEKAIVIRQESGKSYVDIDRNLLGSLDYVLDDFEGFYELSSDGIAEKPTEESKRYYFGTHDIYLKFNESPLYSIVDDLGNALSQFTPCKRMQLTNEVDFNDYYVPTDAYGFSSGSPNFESTIYSFFGKGILKLESKMKKQLSPEVKIYSAKLTKTNNKNITYETVVKSETDYADYYDVYHFYGPEGVASVGTYTLTFDVDFADEEFRGFVSVINVPSYTVNITVATEDEYFEVVDEYFNNTNLFLLQNGSRISHQASGYVSNTSDFKHEDGAKIAIEPGTLSSNGNYFDSEHIIGLKFDYGKLYYRYKLTQDKTFSTIKTASGKEFYPSIEGYYRIYFVPDIYAEITKDTSVFGASRGDKWSDDSDCWTKVPSIEIYVKTDTHDYISNSDLDKILFLTTYVGLDDYYDFATFKNQLKNNSKDNVFAVINAMAPLDISEFSDYMLTNLFSPEIPDYITIEIKNPPSSYTVLTTSRYSQQVNGSEDLWYFYERRQYSFTLVVTLDKGQATERELFNSTIYMQDSTNYNRYNRYLSYRYHEQYGNQLPNNMIPESTR